tara:strand:- start:35072 stop:35356 length:285 start_codon:yes stop_codon:yes gene_type:complete
MKIFEIFAEEVLDEKQIWGRKGTSVVRKYRCTSGQRKGRIVAKPDQCFKPINIKARIRMRRLRSQKGAVMVRRAKRTKRTNPASRRLRILNRKR